MRVATTRYADGIREMGQLLSTYQSKSLEILTLDGREASELHEGSSAPVPIGSLRDFVKLRVIEAPYWSLVSCVNLDPWHILIRNVPRAERPSLLKFLPRSLEVIRLFVDYYQERYLQIIRLELKCMIQNKREMYPRLTKVKLGIRYITRKEGLAWNCVYARFMGCLGGLSMKENVQLIIH